jgi:hypothetical protein
VDRNTEREDLLRAVVAADLALQPERQRFRVQRLESHAGALLLHSGFGLIGERDSRECNRQDVEDLAARGLIRIDKLKRNARGRTFWEEWQFDVTDEGFEQVEREQRAAHEAERGAQEGASGGYDWATDVLPVLEAVYVATGSGDADLGVSQKTINDVLGRQPDDARTARVVTMLVSGGYLDRTIDTFGSRGFVQITEKGLQITAGWPSGAPDAAYQRLLALIDERVEGAASDEERSKWQRLRDAVVGVGRDVAVEVLSAAAQTGLRHI